MSSVVLSDPDASAAPVIESVDGGYSQAASQSILAAISGPGSGVPCGEWVCYRS